MKISPKMSQIYKNLAQHYAKKEINRKKFAKDL